MATLSPDVRDSTLRSLKLTCPSADDIDRDPPSAVSTPDSPQFEMVGQRKPNPFQDAIEEWSDEEVLIPRTKKKVHYTPFHVKITATGSDSPSTSDGMGSASPSPNSKRGKVSPPLPPKSPSRPELKPGGNQDDLVQRFYQVTRERDALRKELQRRSMGPEAVPGLSIYKSEEKTLIEELYALREEIRVWSERYFSGPLSSRSKGPHLHGARSVFASLTDNYQTYLKHPEDRPLLIQAYIWSKLQQKVFSSWQKGCGYVWAAKLGDKQLRPLNDTLRKAVKNETQAEEYHRWRATTVNLLVPQVDGKWCPTFDTAPVFKIINRFCGRMRKKLRPWSTHSLRAGKEQLHTIVSASVALDLKMKRQRADYRLVTFTGGKKDQFWGYGFYDSEMEDIDDDEDDMEYARRPPHTPKGRRVELALAPALERNGNANGHIFDQSFILVKADVSCHRLEKPQKPKASQYPKVPPKTKALAPAAGVATNRFWNKDLR